MTDCIQAADFKTCAVCTCIITIFILNYGACVFTEVIMGVLIQDGKKPTEFILESFTWVSLTYQNQIEFPQPSSAR